MAGNRLGMRTYVLQAWAFLAVFFFFRQKGYPTNLFYVFGILQDQFLTGIGYIDAD